MKRYLHVSFISLAIAAAVLFAFLSAPPNLAHVQAVHKLTDETAVKPASLEAAMPYFRGLVDQKAGDLNSAEDEFMQALKTRHEPFAGAHLVEIWQTQGRYDKILGFLETGQRLEEGYARILIASSILHVPTTESQRWFDVVKARYPGALLRASQELSRAGRYDEAAQWSDAVSDPTQKFEAVLVRGISDFYRGKLKDAEMDFERAYQGPLTADVNYWYGRVLTLNGRPQLAVPILEESVRQATAGLLPWALRELGSAYALAARCNDAIAAFDRSVLIDSSTDNQERIRQARQDARIACSASQP